MTKSHPCPHINNSTQEKSKHNHLSLSSKKTITLNLTQERGYVSYRYRATPATSNLTLRRSQSSQTVSISTVRETLWNRIQTSSESYDLGTPSVVLDYALQGFISTSVSINGKSITLAMTGFSENRAGNVTIQYPSNNATCYIYVITDINS